MSLLPLDGAAVLAGSPCCPNVQCYWTVPPVVTRGVEPRSELNGKHVCVCLTFALTYRVDTMAGERKGQLSV